MEIRRLQLLTFLLAMALASSALAADCAPGSGIGMLVSPRVAVPGQKVHVLVASVALPAADRALLTGGGESRPLVPTVADAGPPAWRLYTFDAPAAGTYRFELVTDATEHCASVAVADKVRPRPRKKGVWPLERQWSPEVEHLYAAWLAHLFDAPEGTSWKALHEVTRDPKANLLHNHLGLGEDDGDRRGPLRLNPDCADNPYFLRAYFAWKLGLPFGFHHCDRGRRERAPACRDFSSNLDGRPGRDEVRDFYLFSRKLKGAIHSGSARTALSATATDLYPVPLTVAALRPGTVFADPYGHTLMLVRRVPQEGDRPGLLMAVDAQPDSTVTVKRFWRGNFLFATEEVTGGPGFKAFRPIVVRRGKPTPVPNADLTASSGYAPFDLAQAEMAPVAFYDAMMRVENPLPVPPEKAYRQLHEALYEQVLTRVTAVDNGEAWHREHPGKTIAMPSGAAIFQTSGPWEDFSTPSRDMRLLIALDTVLDFPEQVARMPAAFVLPSGQSVAEVRKGLLARHGKWAAEYQVAYRNSAGEEVKLTLQDLMDRRSALEMGYNPNDCPERRWGAPEGSAELQTCRRRAPSSQLKTMRTYRRWFMNRRRPAWD